ncbi:MAG: dTDP-4-dehydrorhamnose reductase [Sedimentisphaerales bacterium]
MVKDRVAILGGKGMLGSDLALACQQHQLITTVLDLPEFDITNENHLTNALKGVDAVINCAAYTNVEKAESEAELAYKVNAEAAGKLGLVAKDAGVWVLHISTDFVFDGKSNRPYVETDTPNPINVYGASKLAGEELLVESRCRHCIMRIEWTYGSAGGNFVAKMIKRAKAGERLKIVDDQIGSPTATVEIAKVICKLLPKRPEGLFHFASADYVSRFEMARFIFDKLNMSVDLSSCKTADFPTVAARPLNSRFNCSKIKTLLDKPIEPWQLPLERFLEGL